jgi:hypothetical protein
LKRPRFSAAESSNNAELLEGQSRLSTPRAQDISSIQIVLKFDLAKDLVLPKASATAKRVQPDIFVEP